MFVSQFEPTMDNEGDDDLLQYRQFFSIDNNSYTAETKYCHISMTSASASTSTSCRRRDRDRVRETSRDIDGERDREQERREISMVIQRGRSRERERADTPPLLLMASDADVKMMLEDLPSNIHMTIELKWLWWKILSVHAALVSNRGIVGLLRFKAQSLEYTIDISYNRFYLIIWANIFRVHSK